MKKIIIFIFCFCTVFCFSQNAKIDSLKKVLLTSKEDTSKVNALNELAWEMKYVNTDSCILLSNQALQIALKINNLEGIATSYHRLAHMYEIKGDYPEALHNNLQAIKIRERTKDKNSLSASYTNTGLVYRYLKEYEKALEYYTKALKIETKKNLKPNLIISYNNIAVLYSDMGKHQQALEYYSKSIQFALELKDTVSMSMAYGNIGITYLDLHDTLQALNNYFKALELSEKAGSEREVAIWKMNIGQLYCSLGEYKLAEEYLKKSLSIHEKLQIPEIKKYVHEYLYELYETTGNYKMALNQYIQFIALRDTIFNQENTKKQTQIEMQYEFDKKEAQTKAEQEKKDAVTNIIIYSVSGGLFLVLILAGFIFRSYRQKQKANIIISQQKSEVEKQKNLVEEKQKDILDSIHYAKRIQQSLLPTEKYIEKKLNELKK